ncbi:hypothetical protein QUB70_14500 [Microcoleus sp. A003_D6]|uniref:hypothetical protein n=1 Tax=Microcoleus sp. A003_D6 TaxID=3055266 RepID=UPI002FD55F8E
MPIPQKVFSLVGWASCPSENLLKRTFARSLLKDAIERPVAVKNALNTQSNDWCLECQNTLNSPEFISGLKRLIFHEYDSEAILDTIWIAKAKVSPVNVGCVR